MFRFFRRSEIKAVFLIFKFAVLMTLCWPQWYQIVHLMMDTIDVCIASATIQYTIFISNQHSNIVLTGRMQKLSFQLSYRKRTWNLISVGKWFLINPCESMHERYIKSNRMWRNKWKQRIQWEKKQLKEIPCVQEPKQINECKKGMCWCRIAYHMLFGHNCF